MKHALQHLHFVGIGGSGMSGVAQIAHAQGYVVSGSDQRASPTTERLAAQGVRIAVGHASGNVAGAQAVVISTAVAADNPEVLAARQAGVPVVPRAQMLAELVRGRQCVCVAGTHGKTTTTALTATALAADGGDPGYVVGGTLVKSGSGAHWGRGDAMVLEADESDASFLHYAPVVAVVTNIDEDHMETYGHQRDRLDQAFLDFLHRLPFWGTAVLCDDDPGVQRLLPRVQRPVRRYGLGQGAVPGWRATALQAQPGGGMRFLLQRPGDAEPLPVHVPLSGEHNVRNALAALAAADVLGVAPSAAARALAGFGGVGRRFQRWGDLRSADGGRFTLIDDYGHHPVELQAVLAAARGAYPGRPLRLVFQPHRYSRTRDCFEGFVQVLRAADAVVLGEVYAAGEAPIAGASAQALATAAGCAPPVAGPSPVMALVDAVAAQARNGEVVLTVGAGSIGEVPAALKARCGLAAAEGSLS